MNQDFLYRISQYTLIEDTWLVDAARLSICIFAWVTAALLAKLYWEHKTGNMNRLAAYGVVLTYFGVGYAQIVAISSPFSQDALTLLNVVVLIAVVVSFLGASKVMRIDLFREKDD